VVGRVVGSRGVEAVAPIPRHVRYSRYIGYSSGFTGLFVTIVIRYICPAIRYIRYAFLRRIGVCSACSASVG
jgi:hypothetical protein